MAAMDTVNIVRSDSPRLSACWRASSSGDLTALVTAREDGGPWSERTCRNAARRATGSDLVLLTYAHGWPCPWDEKTCECAATRGHLEVLKRRRRTAFPWLTQRARRRRRRRLGDPRTARENGAAADRPVAAARRVFVGLLEIAQWAVANGAGRDKKTLRTRRCGQTAVLDWAKANGCLEA